MKLKIVLCTLFVAGFVTSLAIAKPPPGKGNAKKGSSDSTMSSTGSTSTSTTTTAAGKKLWVCHKTGSKRKPYVLIRISRSAWAAHRAHGDVLPNGRTCPSSAAGSTTSTATTTTVST